MKRYFYSMPMLSVAVIAAIFGVYEITMAICGFLFGFLLAVQLVYKRTTGDEMGEDDFTKILNEIL